MNNSFDVNVIKESGDVEEYYGGDKVAFDSCLSMVDKAEGGVSGVVVVSRSKLGVGEDVEGVGIGEDASGDNFFQELTTALEEADGVVGFG